MKVGAGQLTSFIDIGKGSAKGSAQSWQNSLADHSLDGIDLSGIMFDGESLPDRSLVWNGAAIRSGPWKLIRETKGNRKDAGFQLFRLDEDPGEKNDLARRFPERVKAMKQSLERWKSDMAATATAQPGQ